MADSSVAQRVIVSYTNREEGEESAAAYIVSDTNMLALHLQMSDSTSGIAANQSDTNTAARETTVPPPAMPPFDLTTSCRFRPEAGECRRAADPVKAEPYGLLRKP